MSEEGFLDVLALSELPPGSQKTVYLGHHRILLCRPEEQIYAVSDVCPHALQPLAGGRICDGVIQCRKHGASFDLTTGRPVNQVTDQRLKTYRLRVRGERIELETGDGTVRPGP